MFTRRYIPCFLIFTLFNSQLAIYAQTKSDLKRLSESTPLPSIHLQRAIAKEIKDAIGAVTYYGEVNPSSQLNEFDKAINEVVQQYELKKKEVDAGQIVLKSNIALLDWGIAAGITSAAASGGSSLFLSGVGVLSQVGLDKVVKLGEEQARKDLGEILQAGFAKVTDKAERESLLNIKDPQMFRTELERRIGPLLGNALDAIPAQDQVAVNNFRDKFLAGVVRDGMKSLSEKQQSQQGQLDNNKKDIQTLRKNVVGLARTFASYARDTKDQLDKLQKNQQEIKGDIEELSKKTDQTQKDIGFIQQFMFGRMTPEEQVNALKAGMFKGMPDKEREDLLKKIGLEQKRKEFNDTLSKYVNGANQVLQIAKNLGVEGPFIEKAGQVVEIGTKAFNAFAAFSSGNFLAGVGAISSFFGDSGRDVATERHEEIKKMLGTMYNQLERQDKKIDALLQGQQTIINNQKLILESIRQLDEQVQRNHQEAMDKLQRIHGDVIVVREMLKDEVNTDYQLCKPLIFDNNNSRIIDTAKGIYPSTRNVNNLFKNNIRQEEVKTCLNRLGRVSAKDDKFQGYFYLDAYTSPTNNAIREYLTEVYRPLIELLGESFYLESQKVDLRYASLLAPMTRVQDIDIKIKHINSPYDAAKMQNFQNQMRSLLYPSMVQRHTNYVLNIHYYHQITNNKDEPLSLRDLLSLKQVRQTGLRQLEEAQKLVDVAVAQQALISGDVLLPILEEIVNKKDGTDKEKNLRITALAAIKSNYFLAKNFIMYCIRKEVAAKSKFGVYSIGLGGESNISFLKDATSAERWDFIWSKEDIKEKDSDVVIQPKGWSVKLGDSLFVGLPGSEELLDGKLAFPSDLNMLLGLRSRIIEEIAGYRIFDQIQGKEQRRRLNMVFLNSF